MNDLSINFSEKIIVDESIKKRDKKLETISFVFIVFLLLLISIVFSINLIYSLNLNKAQLKNDELISELQTDNNKKKEELYFLTQDRLKNILSIQNSMLKMNNSLRKIYNLNLLLHIDSFQLIDKNCDLTIKTQNYAAFESFIKNIEDYDVVKSSVVVGQTKYKDGFYTISLRFTFK